MNGITEPLPGLLDDPQFQIADLPALTDFQIAPLRNPAPTRHANVPLPLEPLAGNILNNARASKNSKPREDPSEKKRGPKITPSDVLLAREAKKPHLAISELLEANNGPEIAPTQLPSFISLSVVEKSPIQAPTSLEDSRAQKRLKLDGHTDYLALDSIRRLPRPAQKDDRPNRPTPLLPAIVTGLHEPPPSAALLPSIDVDSRPVVTQAVATSKIHVKDILSQSDHTLPPSASATAPVSVEQESLPSQDSVDAQSSRPQDANSVDTAQQPIVLPWKDSKPRRVRRKWSDHETQNLIAGVRKHGVGRWKQILDDPVFEFSARSSVDLKDRYRVCHNNDAVSKFDVLPTNSPPEPEPAPEPEQATGSQEKDSAECPSPTKSHSEPVVSYKPRRKRHAWTNLEDDNLLKGVAKHGFQWTAIHDDPELDLKHRRATDLRDRIRNRFPEGYKNAESKPIRSYTKRSEREGDSTIAITTQVVATSGVSAKTPIASPTQQNTPAPTHTYSNMTGPIPMRTADNQNKLLAPFAPVAMSLNNNDKHRELSLEKDRDRDREKEKDHPGVTLPSFTLEIDANMDWEDNTLPPLHEWDEIGI